MSQKHVQPATCCAEKSYIAVECIKYVMHMRHEVTLLCKILWVRALNSHLLRL